MISTILAIDEQDEVLGSFYTECLYDLENFENAVCVLKSIRSSSLNDLAISLSLPNDERFIFLAYSHGSESELLAQGITPYISESLNIHIFKGAFFIRAHVV